MATEKNIYQRLLEVQKEAVAPREINGRFGKARSAEQILEAYKPVCNKHGLFLSTSDEVVQVGERNYVIATATVVNVDKPDEKYSATAEAWEGQIVNGLDTSQVTGKTSSYAKKYSLQNLFAIDDTKDADIEHADVPVDVSNSAQTDTATTDDGGALARAKVTINDELATLDYTTVDSKRAFIKRVLKKETIDNLNDADSVADAIDNEKLERFN